MPVGIQRYNQRHKHPNDRIVFIKPLPGPGAATAKDFLERVAAVCVPIMKAAAISVMTLEEHEPNREFLGRNFNAGEVVQLVLKSKSGRWLPFNFVQMVMMHELAHCLQMNHGRNFWKVNNQFRDELKALWQRGYTGEGIWGRGRSLYSGQIANDSAPSQDDIPQSLCGGTYRSRRRKRKRGPDASGKTGGNLTYAERKQRRIAKKFGQGGSSLGEDEETRILLERGKAAGKPRVAKSKRGRELAAAAALLRFEQNRNAKSEQDELARSGEDEGSSASDTDSSTSDVDSDSGGGDSSSRIQTHGRSFVKICEADDRDEHDGDAMQELRDLQTLSQQHPTASVEPLATGASGVEASETDESTADEESQQNRNVDITPSTAGSNSDTSRAGKLQAGTAAPPASLKGEEATSIPAGQSAHSNAANDAKARTQSSRTVSIGSIAYNPPAVFNAPYQRSNSPPFRFPSAPSNAASKSGMNGTDDADSTPAVTSAAVECSVCSLANDAHAVTCAACANVLDRGALHLHWRCTNDACITAGYVNSADAGVCGLCGQRKPSG